MTGTTSSYIPPEAFWIGLARAKQEHQIKVLAGIHFFNAWRLRPCYSELPDPSPAHDLEGADGAPSDARIEDDISVESEPDSHCSDAGDGKE